MSTYRKRIPYGMMNFVTVRRDDCYYVDKTRFIPTIEQANKFFFYIRPRRFGKSLTISMLHHYYDVLAKDMFEELYGGLYIGKHPTPERNSYLVLYLNFSVVDAGLNDYRKALDAHCNTEFERFCRRYAAYLPDYLLDNLKTKSGAVEQLDYLYKEVADAGQKIFLFIDEYDHFTNKILSEPSCLNEYRGETHGTGYLRTFFDTIKSGTYSSIERCFVTGVSPVTMDDLTSGFNIGTNYSTSHEFNELTGFTEEDVREMLDYYRTTCEFHHTTDELITRMKPWYDNYCFAKQSYGKTTMYNSNMVLYFVDNYIRNGGQLPDNMMYPDWEQDHEDIRKYILLMKNHPHGVEMLESLQQQGYVLDSLERDYTKNPFNDPSSFGRILYSWGLLVINGMKRVRYMLVVPNQMAHHILFN